MDTNGNSSFLESSLEKVCAVFGQLQPHLSIPPKNDTGRYCTSSADFEKSNSVRLENISAPDLVFNGSTKSNFYDSQRNPQPSKMTKKQQLCLAMCALANFGCAVCVSLQAPFFPREAAEKGIRPSVYGLVFGAFSLTVCILAPFLGKYITRIGPLFLLNTGIFVTSFCCILFGLLDKIQSGTWFITYAFIVRIVEAAGDASFNTASYTIMAQTFPDRIGFAFAWLRSSFGVGLILGPAIGGMLYDCGGYTIPFAAMGSTLFLITIIMCFLFRRQNDAKSTSTEDPSLLKALKIPSVLLAMASVWTGAFSIGFLSATLEPHLRQFDLKPTNVGFMFIISGGAYALTTFIWGKLCQEKLHPKLVIALGSFFMCITYILIGPSPFINVETKLWMCIVALCFHGVGVGGQLLGSHIEALNLCIKGGFPPSFETNGMVAGLWAASFQFGNFVGPSVGGFLLDGTGFRMGTVIVCAMQTILMCVLIGYYFLYDRKKPCTVNEKTSLL